jgi:hypothetical protein
MNGGLRGSGHSVTCERQGTGSQSSNRAGGLFFCSLMFLALLVLMLLPFLVCYCFQFG